MTMVDYDCFDVSTSNFHYLKSIVMAVVVMIYIQKTLLLCDNLQVPLHKGTLISSFDKYFNPNFLPFCSFLRSFRLISAQESVEFL